MSEKILNLDEAKQKFGIFYQVAESQAIYDRNLHKIQMELDVHSLSGLEKLVKGSLLTLAKFYPESSVYIKEHLQTSILMKDLLDENSHLYANSETFSLTKEKAIK
jgi:hypothetical protein